MSNPWIVLGFRLKDTALSNYFERNQPIQRSPNHVDIEPFGAFLKGSKDKLGRGDYRDFRKNPARGQLSRDNPSITFRMRVLSYNPSEVIW